MLTYIEELFRLMEDVQFLYGTFLSAIVLVVLIIPARKILLGMLLCLLILSCALSIATILYAHGDFWPFAVIETIVILLILISAPLGGFRTREERHSLHEAARRARRGAYRGL